MDYVIVIFLVLLSGIFSGLTLGFFSLSKDDIFRKAELGDKRAKKIYSVRKNGNLLLTTLLIGNVAVNATLSIYLGSITSGFTAGLIATALIVIFGEIVPQASFSRYAMKIGGRLVWLTRIFIVIFLPVSWPIAWVLNKILGKEINNVYSKKELAKMIEEHEDSRASDIDADEERIIKGALSYSDKKVKDIMTPRISMFALQSNEVLTENVINRIYNAGHSRIPVYRESKDEINGILYVKDLIGEKCNGKRVGELAREKIIFVDSEKTLDNLLNDFKKTRQHLFVVLNEFGGVSGLVTVEDVLEEIIGSEILDEFDRYGDMQQVAREKMKKKNIKKI